MLTALLPVGVDIRPEAMSVTGGHVEPAALTLASCVSEAGLWATVIDLRPVTHQLISVLRDGDGGLR